MSCLLELEKYLLHLQNTFTKAITLCRGDPAEGTCVPLAQGHLHHISC